MMRRADPRPHAASSARQRGKPGRLPGSQQSPLHAQVRSVQFGSVLSTLRREVLRVSKEVSGLLRRPKTVTHCDAWPTTSRTYVTE